MSSFNVIKDMALQENDVPEETTPVEPIVQIDAIVPPMMGDQPVEEPPPPVRGIPFDVTKFAQELHDRSHAKNKIYAEMSENISAYDVAHNCIRQVIYKLRNAPVESFADKWLPIQMRATIGTAIHEFVQSSGQFTEQEVSLKIPSVHFSGRLDCLIGNNILVEIKGCTYSDYRKIIKTRSPRIADYLQTLTYKIMLEEYLEESKKPGVERRSPPPSLPKYEIDTFQYIYVAHDVCASDAESIEEALAMIKKVKGMLNSGRDKFFFMTSLVMNLDGADLSSHIDWIKRKISAINKYIDNNTIPPETDPFVDKHGCFFCLYKNGACDIG